jgi:hypothetical protein
MKPPFLDSTQLKIRRGTKDRDYALVTFDNPESVLRMISEAQGRRVASTCIVVHAWRPRALGMVNAERPVSPPPHKRRRVEESFADRRPLFREDDEPEFRPPMRGPSRPWPVASSSNSPPNPSRPLHSPNRHIDHRSHESNYSTSLPPSRSTSSKKYVPQSRKDEGPFTFEAPSDGPDKATVQEFVFEFKVNKSKIQVIGEIIEPLQADGWFVLDFQFSGPKKIHAYALSRQSISTKFTPVDDGFQRVVKKIPPFYAKVARETFKLETVLEETRSGKTVVDSLQVGFLFGPKCLLTV